MKYEDRLQLYISEKKRLERQDLTPAQYQAAIRKLADKYRI